MMAETKELRHAGIGIDLNVNGLEEFRKANSMLDDFMRSFHEITGQADKLKESLGSGLNITRDVNQSKDSMAGFRSELRKTAQQADTFKHNLDFSNVGAKDTESMRKLNDQAGKLRSDKITQIKTEMQESNKSTNDGSEAIKKYSDHVDEAHHRMRRLHDIIFGSFVGTAISNGIQAIGSGLWQSAKNGFELAEAGERISGQWKNIGLTTKQTEALTAQIGDIRSKADMSGGAIDSMQKKLYALTNSVPVTKTLTNEMAAYGSEAGKTGEQIQQMTSMVAKSLGSKKVSAGFFNRVFGQMPALRKQIQEASGMTNSAFNSALENSKITGAEMQSWMIKAAKGSGSAWKAFGETTAGQIAAIKGEWQNLEVAFAKPLSAGFAKGMDSMTGKNSGLKSARKELENVVKLLGAKVGDYAGKAVAFIGQHHSDLNKIATSLFSIVKNLAIGIWKPFATIIGKLGGQSGKAAQGLEGFSKALDSISKHQQAIQNLGKAMVGLWAASKAFKGVNMAKNFVGFGDKAGLILKPKIDGKAGEKELTLFSRAIRGTVRGIGKSLIWTAKVNWKKGAKTAFLGIKAAAMAAARGVRAAFIMVKNGAFIAGKGIKTAFTFMKANPLMAIATAAVAVSTALYELYKHNKMFRKFVNGLISWAKKAWKGITRWFGNIGKGVVKSFGLIYKSVSKRWGNLWKDEIKVIKDGWKVIKSVLQVFYDFFTGHWSKLGKDISKLTKNLWKMVKGFFKGGFDFVNDLTGGKLEKMAKAFSNTWKGIGKGWKSFWNGISDWFGDLWKGIVKRVQDGINNVIKVLNLGIKGIDWVISKFGGSSKAIGTINPVHLATGTGAFSGTRRAITKPTMAVLNDGNDSPETGNREMLIHPNGMSELIRGTNVKRLLEPGAEVLNASETKFAMSLNGMSHFAKGTGLLSNLWNGAKSVGSSVVGGVEKGFGAIGNFAGGILKATKKVFDTVKSIVKDPSKYLTGLLKKPSGKGTVLSDFANGFFGKMKSSATNWWKSLWGMVNLDGGSGGDATGLLAAVEKYGRGKRYVWGAAGPNTFDCSGLVMYALKHAFGIDYPHYSGAQYGKTKHISRSNAKPGDLVFWGPGKHVGVFAGGNKYWSAFAPNGHPDIGMHSISGSVPGYSPLFGEVRGLARKTVSKGKKSASNSIQSLIKKQVGSGFFKFMSKLADMFGDDAAGSYGNPAGDGVSRWRKYVVKALKANGFSASPSQISAWMRVIARESNGNPKAINNWDSNAKAGHPSKGLVQTIDSTFSAYKFKGHDQIYNGFDDLLAGINYMKHIYGKGPSAFARVSGPKGYAKGGHINRNKLSIVGEKGWELFKPDTAGTVIPHEASEKLISGGSKGKVTISAPTKVVIQGNADKSAIDELDSRLEKRNDDLVEKLRELWGLNDEGGLTV